MAEVATVPATQEAPAIAASPMKAAGRGRGKGKKGRGKFKGKAKKRIVATADGEVVKKPPKLDLRKQVEQEVGDRPIEDVIKEAKAKVDALQAAVNKAQEDEMAYEKNIKEGKTAMTDASARVDECVNKETIALEKLKDAKKGLIDAQKVTAAKRLACTDEVKALEIIENEGEQRQKEADLLKSKADAQAAKEAAKEAYKEALAKAKEVTEEIKHKRQALALTDDPEAAERAKKEAEQAAEEEKARREAKSIVSHAEKDLKAENKQLERERAQRDKERAKAFKEAAGLGSKKRALDGGASPAKAAKIQDVD